MEKNFKEIYEKIYNENGIQNIEQSCNKRSSNILKAFGITMFIIMVFPPALIIALPILVVYVIISSSKEKMSEEEEYVDMYKEKFILPLLREIFPDVLYRPKDSLPLDKYLEAEYKDNFVKVNEIDQYNSNDHIILPVKVSEEKSAYIDIYDVKLETRSHSSRNGSNRLTIYEGLTASISLPKSINTKIKLSPKIMTNFIGSSTDLNEINTNFPDFDKYFTISAEQKELASRIYTVDVMQKLLDILDNCNCAFNINIINDKLYVRVRGFNIFEYVIVLGNDKHMHIEKSVKAVETIKELTCLIYEIIDNTDM